MRHARTAPLHPDRGATAVEFALIVLPLLMLVFGIVNFGVVFAQQLALDNSVRAGARAGVVDRGPSAPSPEAVTTAQFDDTALARSLAGTLSVTNPSGVGATCKGSDFGESLVVRGSVTTNFLIPWPVPTSVVPRSMTLTSQAEFQCEYE